METHCLLPNEFFLHFENGLFSVCTKQHIPKGVLFFPFQGENIILKASFLDDLPDSDIRWQFGCSDGITRENNVQLRRCNWVRFLHQSTEKSFCNVRARISDESIFYETLRSIDAGVKLTVYFEESQAQRSLSTSPIPNFLNQTSLNSATSQSFVNKLLNSISTITSVSSSLNCPMPMSTISGFSVEPFSLQAQIGKQPTQFHQDENDAFLRTALKQKQTNVPSPERNKPEKKCLFPCELCGKPFDRPSLLRRHIRTHTGERPFSCDICQKAFSTSSSLNTHRRIHTGDRPHQCQLCGKRFTASSNLYYHRMTHDKEKPHKCQFCKKTFPTPGDLKSHEYIHSGKWPFVCRICNRGFSKQTNLKNHLLLHTGDKPFECKFCSKRFALNCNYKTHLKIHENETGSENNLTSMTNICLSTPTALYSRI